MEEASTPNVCVSCGGSFPKLDEQGKCENCAGGSNESMDSQAEAPASSEESSDM